MDDGVGGLYLGFTELCFEFGKRRDKAADAGSGPRSNRLEVTAGQWFFWIGLQRPRHLLAPYGSSCFWQLRGGQFAEMARQGFSYGAAIFR